MKLALVMALILSGCSSTNVSNRQISAFKNDELCKALGTYNNDGPTVLRLTTELERRGMSINQERCYALSRMNMNRRDYIIYGDTNNNMGNCSKGAMNGIKSRKNSSAYRQSYSNSGGEIRLRKESLQT
ncbi:MAG: hypothetical protein ACMZI0_06615 [Symbiopectobacterium sp.]|uniref:hypothetical protein n=1 Tax=Symbiopectobacterium sp. TaxID=2952789 RepID=UPI0039E79B83